jgi:ParB/RepB/Spo0J family partition protein
MTLQTVKLSELKPPTSNPRHVICKHTLEGLAESIRNDGLLQNLVVAPLKGKKNGNGFRIISGERRFRALQLLAEQGAIDEGFEIPVEVRSHLSKEDVLRLATIENLQRENLPPLDEAAALATLIKGGERLAEIAAKTGLCESTIKRRVVLNTLCEEAKKALREGTVSLAQAEALTLGNDDAQRNVLDEIERYGGMDAESIREHFLDDRPTVAMAIFPIEEYTGTITTDLFAEGESSYFDDAEQFFNLQREAVQQLAAEYGQSAAWVEVTDSYRIPDWQYDEAPEGEQGGVLINLSPSGVVEIREGLLRPELDEETREQTAQHPARLKAALQRPAAPLRRMA